MTNAVEVSEHWHARIGLNPRDEVLPAARHDHVDRPGGGQHRADHGAVLRWYELHRGLRNPGIGKSARHRGMDRAIGMYRFAAPTQQNGVARAQAQGSGIDGNVGTTFVDDANQTDGYAHPRQDQPVRPHCGIDLLADWIGQPRNLLDRGGNRFQSNGIEPQPVEHGGGQPSRLARGEIFGVCRKDSRCIGTQCLGGAHQCRSLGVIAHPCQQALRIAPRPGHVGNDVSRRKGTIHRTGLAGRIDAVRDPRRVWQIPSKAICSRLKRKNSVSSNDSSRDSIDSAVRRAIRFDSSQRFG